MILILTITGQSHFIDPITGTLTGVFSCHYRHYDCICFVTHHIISLCFAVDSPYYKEERICMTWKDGQGVLLREYSREKKGREKQGMLRKERQEYPRMTISEASKGFHR
ncbi:MAG: hypothetical protein WA941_20235 [Nitrososphaeraceae archaeon]